MNLIQQLRIQFFGKSKLAGENFVRELNPKHLIVRSSWVYAKEGSCFVNSVIRQAKEGGVIQVAAEQYSSPTSAKVLADFVMKMIDANEYGIYHASCEGCCSRVEAAEEILRCMGQDPTGRIEEISAEAGKNSPRRTDLQNLMMKVTGIYQMPDWKDAMRDYIACHAPRHCAYHRHYADLEDGQDLQCWL